MNDTTAVEAAEDAVEEATVQAFYGRIDHLYRTYEDWTGQTEEESAPEGTAPKAASERQQSNGQKCIEPVEALSTFAVFTARLAVDFEMDRDDFIEMAKTMFDNELDEDGDDDDDDEAPGTQPS
jgi:hypothetical protein